MSIETREGQIVESVGTTVSLVKGEFGEFNGVYYDTQEEKFVTVKSIDIDLSEVDANLNLKIKYASKRFNSRPNYAPHISWGLTKEQHKLLVEAYGDNCEDLQAVWRLLNARAEGIILYPFYERMVRQLIKWTEIGYLIYHLPFSSRQMSILKKQRKYYDQSYYRRRHSPQVSKRPAAYCGPEIEIGFGESVQPRRPSPAEHQRDSSHEEAGVR